MRKIARKLYRAIPFKQPTYETLRRLISVPEPIYRHLHFQGVIEVAAEEASFRMWHHGYQIEKRGVLVWTVRSVGRSQHEGVGPSGQGGPRDPGRGV